MVIIAVIILSGPPTEHSRPTQSKDLAYLKSLGYRIKLYAEDNQGQLPRSIEQLTFPNMRVEDQYYATKDINFLTPGVRLDDLTAETVILRRAIKETQMEAVVRGDFSAELQQVQPR